jgi:hypothetical protein
MKLKSYLRLRGRNLRLQEGTRPNKPRQHFASLQQAPRRYQVNTWFNNVGKDAGGL